MRLLGFLLLLPCLAFGQGITTLNNGDPADANTVNANFQHLNGRIQAIEDAGGEGGGCTVEQVGNSAEITCSDGSTAVVPGYGTVVVYPEGTVGELPVVSWPTGAIVVIDADGVMLGESDASGDDWFNIELDLGKARIANTVDGAIAFSAAAPHLISYLEPDCAGLPFGQGLGLREMVSDSGTFYFASRDIGSKTLLRESFRRSAYLVGANLVPATECTNSRVAATLMRPLVEYTPAPEILNAAYPVRLEQLP